MKFTYSWLKDFVQIKISPKALAQKLTMAGIEVTSLEEKNGDVVFEVEVTANRPDCLSILGIAQEVAALTQKKLKLDTRYLMLDARKKNKIEHRPFDRLRVVPSEVEGRGSNIEDRELQIKIQDKKGCPYYRGCLIKDVKVAPSPDWLRNRLEALGVRPVNNVVDITNYCLLEYGQPLHAFDYDKIKESIIVRRSKNGEKIFTIDGQERKLDENILVISDKDKAIAIAGIMGDKLSEVGSLTQNILLESAYFNPILIRRSSRQLGLSTDSSYRFERQVDFERVKIAQNRAVKLICELTGGKFVDEKESIGVKINPRKQNVRFDCKKANAILAANISKEKIKKIFASLGFSVKNSSKDFLMVSVPPIRRDIKIEEDLIEELARIYGYENILSTVPAIRTAVIENSTQETMKPAIREVLCGLGFNEVITYSLLSKTLLNAAGVSESVKLENPLSSEQQCLRSMLSSSLINCLAYNLNHKNNDLKLFEISHVFSTDFIEDIAIGLIATGKTTDSWQTKQGVDFFFVKGSVGSLLKNLGYEQNNFLALDEYNVFASGEAAKIICQNIEVGVLGRIDRQKLSNFDIKNPPNVFYAQILLKQLCKCRRKDKKFQPLPVFPSSIRDLSLIAKNTISYQDIREVVEIESGEYLRDLSLTDLYKGEQIAAGCVGLTVNLEFGLDDRTLTEEEVAGIQERIIKRLKADLRIEIRSK